MRFLTIYWPDMQQKGFSSTAAGSSLSVGPDNKMIKYSQKSQEAGILISQGMFGPMATEITLADGGFSTMERTGEAIGYAYLEAESTSDAVRHVKEFLQVAGGGRTLIRQLIDRTEHQG